MYTSLPPVMLHKVCLCCLACFCALLTNPVLSMGTFYKLAGKHDDASVADEKVPFLTKSFFSCGSNQDCAKIAKNEGSSEFKEVNDQQEVKEDAVVYEKINNPKTQEDPTWSEWISGKCSTKCGGGVRSIVRYCYSHLLCKGESSKVESCNTGDCPELQKCKYSTTRYADGLLGNGVLSISAGRSWVPLVGLKPSCNNSGTNFIMKSASLEKNGTEIRYNYSCCGFKIPICHMVVNSTNWIDDVLSWTGHIEKHPIDCGTSAFISSFELEMNSTKSRYSYTCCQVFDQTWKDSMQCKTQMTKFAANNLFETLKLAEIPVSCDAGFGLSRLKLNATMVNWAFEFRCCKVAY